MFIHLQSNQLGTFRALVYCGGMVLIPSPAQAGDVTPPAFDWRGLYIGTNLGAGAPLHGGEHVRAGSGFSSPVFDLYPASNTRTGVTVGAQVGYN